MTEAHETCVHGSGRVFFFLLLGLLLDGSFGYPRRVSLGKIVHFKVFFFCFRFCSFPCHQVV